MAFNFVLFLGNVVLSPTSFPSSKDMPFIGRLSITPTIIGPFFHFDILISYVIVVVFSSRIFRNLDLEIEWVLRCKARELKSLRCIVSHLERVRIIFNRITFENSDNVLKCL